MALLAANIGSACCLDHWGEVEEQPRLADVRLDDVEHAGQYGSPSVIAYGSGGLLLLDDERIELGTTADFHGMASDWEYFGGHVAIVGATGTVALYTEQPGEQPSWTLHQTPTDATLVAVGFHGDHVVAVGDEVVVTLDIETGVTKVIEPPAGGWGSLGVVKPVGYESHLVLAGARGVAWVIDDLDSGDVRRLELGVEEDILAGGHHEDDRHAWLVGAGGLALREDSPDNWRRIDVGTSADFVDFAVGVALTREGDLWDPAQARRIAELPWARGIGEGTFDYDQEDEDPYEDPDVLIVGDGGRFAILEGC